MFFFHGDSGVIHNSLTEVTHGRTDRECTGRRAVRVPVRNKLVVCGNRFLSYYSQIHDASPGGRSYEDLRLREVESNL